MVLYTTGRPASFHLTHCVNTDTTAAAADADADDNDYDEHFSMVHTGDNKNGKLHSKVREKIIFREKTVA